MDGCGVVDAGDEFIVRAFQQKDQALLQKVLLANLTDHVDEEKFPGLRNEEEKYGAKVCCGQGDMCNVFEVYIKPGEKLTRRDKKSGIMGVNDLLLF
jgi:hypothetical protein